MYVYVHRRTNGRTEIYKPIYVHTMHNWPKLASLAQKLIHSIVFSSLVYSLLPKISLLQDISAFTTAGVKGMYVHGKCFPALNQSVSFIL